MVVFNKALYTECITIVSQGLYLIKKNDHFETKTLIFKAYNMKTLVGKGKVGRDFCWKFEKAKCRSSFHNSCKK